MQGIALMLLFAACSGASSDPGTRARLRVASARFVPAPLPPDQGGPKVTSIESTRNIVRPGEVDAPLSGTLESNATAVAIHLFGDIGHWLLPTSPPNVETPDLLSFRASLTFSRDIADGEALEIGVAASDQTARFGPDRRITLTGRSLASTATVAIRLRWDTNADLDLHVVDPNGVEIWARNLNSFESPPPSQPIDPDDVASGGILNLDSNSGCIVDGRREETIAWTVIPPPGRYLVRVDAFSLCGETSANWLVEASREGEIFARARGRAVESDTRTNHDAGAGVLALELDL